MNFLFNLLFVFFLIGKTLACPGEEELAPIVKDTSDAINKAICGQNITPQGAEVVQFLRGTVLPYYISKAWLTKDPPKGWEKETDKIFAKCHKDTYNYCFKDDRKKAGDCVKGIAGSLMLKYGATAMAYCPILDKKLENWAANDKTQALKFVTDFCKTQGTIC